MNLFLLHISVYSATLFSIVLHPKKLCCACVIYTFTQSLMLYCRRMAYVRFVIKYPETLFLWVTLPLQVGLILYGQKLFLSDNLQDKLVHQNITHMSSHYAQWCQINQNNQTDQYCKFVSPQTFSLPSEVCEDERMDCDRICSMSHCSNSTECLTRCHKHFLNQITIRFKQASGYEEEHSSFFLFGGISVFLWIMCCIGSFSDYFYYVQHLKEQSILKQMYPIKVV